MNILIIHNIYSKIGGEEKVVEFQKQLLESKGHNVIVYYRNYNEMNSWFFGKIGGLFTSIFNSRSIKDVKKIIKDFNPHISILHNLFPIISPAIINLLKSKRVIIYQIVHNYRLLCPTGIFFSKGNICEKCTKGLREWNCLINNCTQNYFASFSFSLRGFLVRKLKYYNSVDLFLTISDFLRNILINNGFSEEKVITLSNAYIDSKGKDNEIEIKNKKFIGFVGRLTIEKGILDFIQIARNMPEFEFRVAGQVNCLIESIEIPKNLEFVGFLDDNSLDKFYNSCRVLLVLSKWYEPFGMVILESLFSNTPVIVNDIGAMSQIIEDGKEGFVVEIGDLDLVEKRIGELFVSDEKYSQICYNCRKKVEDKFSSDLYYIRLMQEFKR